MTEAFGARQLTINETTCPAIAGKLGEEANL